MEIEILTAEDRKIIEDFTNKSNDGKVMEDDYLQMLNVSSKIIEKQAIIIKTQSTIIKKLKEEFNQQESV